MKRLAILVAITALPTIAHADVTRTEVIERAKDFTFYPWRATTANLSAPCHAGYETDYVAGDFMGVAYDWGGFDSLFQFSQKIAQGQAAGSPAGGLVTSCTTGVDCSGFVSRTWKTSSKYGTSTLPQISSQIAATSMLAGDIFNDAGNHVVLFSHLLANGEPYNYEAAFSNVHVNLWGWSWVNGYIPRRYQSITGTTVGNPLGTLTNPIVIGSLPFTDSRDTKTAPSSVLDGCAANATANETGPEYVYKIQITQPGQLTVSASDDATADIDVHLLSSFNTSDCTARADTTFTTPVDCGTYYIVADTFGGTANAGAFSLTVTLTPSGSACGNGPPTYNPHGSLGDACSSPNNPALPSCNPTLGADTCIYTSTTSWCSKSCATDSDCADLPGGGCCQDIGDNELYCMTADYCENGGGGAGSGSGSGSGSGDGSGSGSGSDGGGNPATPDGDDPSAGGCSTTGASPLVMIVLALSLLARRRRRR